VFRRDKYSENIILNRLLSRNFSKIGLIGDAGSDDGTGLLEESVVHDNQGELAVLAFGHEAVIERLTRCVSFFLAGKLHINSLLRTSPSPMRVMRDLPRILVPELYS